jgi:hypothetical protein
MLNLKTPIFRMERACLVNGKNLSKPLRRRSARRRRNKRCQLRVSPHDHVESKQPVLFLLGSAIFCIHPASLLVALVGLGLELIISVELLRRQARVTLWGVLLMVFLLPPSVHECN